MITSTYQSDGGVKAWFAAFDARDVERLCAISDPEIEITQVNRSVDRLPGASFHGHQGIRTLMDWSYDRYRDVRVKSVVSRQVPAGVLVETTYAVKEPASPDHHATSFSVFRMRDERIYRIAAFAGEGEALEFAMASGTLTPREREILQMLLDGLNARQIADTLVLSPATVRTHVQNAMVRLGARTRIDAISRALRRGELHL